MGKGIPKGGVQREEVTQGEGGLIRRKGASKKEGPDGKESRQGEGAQWRRGLWVPGPPQNVSPHPSTTGSC